MPKDANHIVDYVENKYYCADKSIFSIAFWYLSEFCISFLFKISVDNTSIAMSISSAQTSHL